MSNQIAQSSQGSYLSFYSKRDLAVSLYKNYITAVDTSTRTLISVPLVRGNSYIITSCICVCDGTGYIVYWYRAPIYYPLVGSVTISSNITHIVNGNITGTTLTEVANTANNSYDIQITGVSSRSINFGCHTRVIN